MDNDDDNQLVRRWSHRWHRHSRGKDDGRRRVGLRSPCGRQRRRERREHMLLPRGNTGPRVSYCVPPLPNPFHAHLCTLPYTRMTRGPPFGGGRVLCRMV